MGTQQSPINLEQKEALHTCLESDLQFNYHLSRLKIVNNGRTIQIKPERDNHLKMEGTNFDLVQFHFHDPSEHTINNKHYPMELHFVHRNKATGELAVLGVLFAIGAENQALKTIWKNLPEDKNVEHSLDNLNPIQLLPLDKRAFRYNGRMSFRSP